MTGASETVLVSARRLMRVLFEGVSTLCSEFCRLVLRA